MVRTSELDLGDIFTFEVEVAIESSRVQERGSSQNRITTANKVIRKMIKDR